MNSYNPTINITLLTGLVATKNPKATRSDASSPYIHHKKTEKEFICVVYEKKNVVLWPCVRWLKLLYLELSVVTTALEVDNLMSRQLQFSTLRSSSFHRHNVYITAINWTSIW